MTVADQIAEIYGQEKPQTPPPIAWRQALAQTLQDGTDTLARALLAVPEEHRAACLEDLTPDGFARVQARLADLIATL